MPSQIARLASYIGHARARYLLVFCGLLLGLILATTSAWFVSELRREAIADTERELKNTALILAEETDRAFQTAELVQLDLIDHMRQMGIDTSEEFARQMASQDAYQLLREHISGVHNLSSLALIDVSGRIVNISRTWPTPRIDSSDRAFFKVLTSEQPPEFFIGEPVQNRTDDTWAIMFVRRFVGSDGKLIGLVSAALQPANFERTFARIAMEGDSTFVLYRNDGMLLARYPHVDPKIGGMFGRTAHFPQVLAISTAGSTIRLASIFDGKDRLIAGHLLEHYPLLIDVSNTIPA